MRTDGAVLSDVNFDILTALQSKLEAIAAYEVYMDDCEEAGDDACRGLFEELKHQDEQQADRLRSELERLVREGKFR